jgi:hypothetical protein
VIYNAMVNSLVTEEGQTMEAARAAFDGQIGVASWRLPGAPEREIAEVDAGAPWWWSGDEDASQSFLDMQGVTLDGGN